MSKLLDQLISEFQNREERGFLKYGTTMDREDLSLSEWVQHALEESMDLCLYLNKIKQQLNDTQRFPDYQEADSRISESINTGGEASVTRTPL
jgi:hypothetical protein